MKLLLFCCSCWLLLVGCKTSGPGIFGKRSQHEQYGAKLESAGLQSTTMAASWFRAAAQALSNPVNIQLPYREMGYFAAETPAATGLLFSARRGERLTISIEKNSGTRFHLFVELWRAAAGNQSQRLMHELDTSTSRLVHDVDADASFILRIQPELLVSGDYTVTIQNGPSLAFPVKTNRQVISSFWGAPRDGGTRRHEGIDIFAPRGTPLIAAADGRITRVNENQLGGKTIWMRPEGKDYTLYYAHLDEQLARPGQQVKAGDTIGTVGNTGNASSTAPHLHFGIYTSAGAIDPLLFVNPIKTTAPAVTGNTAQLGRLVRLQTRSNLFRSPVTNAASDVSLERNTPVSIIAAVGSWYRITTPSGLMGFTPANAIQPLAPIRKTSLAQEQFLLNAPIPSAARIQMMPRGTAVEVLGQHEQYSLIRYEDQTGWVLL